MNRAELLAQINSKIKSNGNKEITGATLNSILQELAYQTPAFGDLVYRKTSSGETITVPVTNDMDKLPTVNGMDFAGFVIDPTIGLYIIAEGRSTYEVVESASMFGLTLTYVPPDSEAFRPLESTSDGRESVFEAVSLMYSGFLGGTSQTDLNKYFPFFAQQYARSDSNFDAFVPSISELVRFYKTLQSNNIAILVKLHNLLQPHYWFDSDLDFVSSTRIQETTRVYNINLTHGNIRQIKISTSPGYIVRFAYLKQPIK